MANTHGGSRPGSGRKPGVPNKLPSRARAAQEKLIEKLEPHLDLVIATAVEMLSDRNVKPADKNATLKLLLDLVTRSAAQDVADTIVEAAGSLSVADLLAGRARRGESAEDERSQ